MTEKTESFERVSKHLHKRQYRNAAGDWQTIYYARFVDWQGKRRKFPLGDKLKPARDALAIYEARNVRREDFDADRKKSMTLADWLKRYLDLNRGKPSHGTKTWQAAHLKRLLGDLPLAEITRVKVMEYKNRRLTEPLMRHGKPVKDSLIQGATVNREVSCLISALNLAADEGLCEGAPKVKKEREMPRDRILTEAEYKALIEAAPRWLQRALITANETAIDQGTLIRLTWDCVQNGLIIVKGGREKTGAKQAVGISPALEEVLRELRNEYRRTPNLEKRILTKGGKPIIKGTMRHAFEKAVSDAKIDDFQFRDFRHCARTRWAAAGLPFEIAETAIGHKLRGIAGRYVNLSDDQIRQAFAEMYKKIVPTLYREKTASAE